MAAPEQLTGTLEDIDHPIVGVTMGSDSDLKFTMPAYDVFDDFGVPYEARIVSAHRTPDWMHIYAEEAAGRGILTILAFAGGSSHLQGMTASETILPVHGVAVEGSADPLNASFGSQLRMPSEAPLATMGKNEAAATNGALHIVRWLSHIFPELEPKLSERSQRVQDEVLAKDLRIASIGPREYRRLQIQEEKEKRWAQEARERFERGEWEEARRRG